MAYQDVKRAIVQPNPPAQVDDDLTQRWLSFLHTNYMNLAQETDRCHNSIVQFLDAIGNGLTSQTIILPIPFPVATYYVGANFSFDNGGWWTSGKTTTQFTLNWATASAGAQSVRLLILN